MPTASTGAPRRRYQRLSFSPSCFETALAELGLTLEDWLTVYRAVSAKRQQEHMRTIRGRRLTYRARAERAEALLRERGISFE